MLCVPPDVFADVAAEPPSLSMSTGASRNASQDAPTLRRLGHKHHCSALEKRRNYNHFTDGKSPEIRHTLITLNGIIGGAQPLSCRASPWPAHYAMRSPMFAQSPQGGSLPFHDCYAPSHATLTMQDYQHHLHGTGSCSYGYMQEETERDDPFLAAELRPAASKLCSVKRIIRKAGERQEVPS